VGSGFSVNCGPNLGVADYSAAKRCARLWWLSGQVKFLISEYPKTLEGHAPQFLFGEDIENCFPSGPTGLPRQNPGEYENLHPIPSGSMVDFRAHSGWERT
jgi:hypothetical protein